VTLHTCSSVCVIVMGARCFNDAFLISFFVKPVKPCVSLSRHSLNFMKTHGYRIVTPISFYMNSLKSLLKEMAYVAFLHFFGLRNFPRSRFSRKRVAIPKFEEMSKIQQATDQYVAVCMVRLAAGVEYLFISLQNV